MPDAEGSRYAGQFPPSFAELHRDSDLLWVVPFRVAFIVGIVGYRYSGKSTALSYLAEKKGFQAYTLSAILRELAEERGIPLQPRSRLQDLGDEVRAENGDGGYLARLLLRRIRRDHLAHRQFGLPARVAIGGFKHPAEVEAFQAVRRFHMIVLDASTEVRWRWSRRDGTLQRELEAIHSVSPDVAGRLDPTFANFKAYVDRRDRTGWNKVIHDRTKGGADRATWVTGYDQNVDGVIACSRRADLDYALDNGQRPNARPKPTGLFDGLDGIVDNLTGQYRSSAL